ncbi:MAG: hypothetical protein ABR535_00275 [Pyrinomonadaceae bacterium]
MNRMFALQNYTAIEPDIRRIAETPGLLRATPLGGADKSETLDFLARRPVHTVVMTSFIIDNGIESELNRGKFFGYRGADGQLEGVALIGHSTLVEARTADALKALAFKARTSSVRFI